MTRAKYTFALQPSWDSNPVQMDFEYRTLSTEELIDILTKSTMRYNQILLQGGPQNEFEMLREAMKLIQQEVEKRKEEG